jgi:hypothetical protein
VSLPRFQEVLARLVIDPEFRELVRAAPLRGLPEGLTGLERRRLTVAAAGRGIEVTRDLHKAWRLTKLLALLPLTCTLLGEEVLAQEVARFWRARLPKGLYFLEEALDFCAYLKERARADLSVPYLDEVVAFERATLELRRPRPAQGSSGLQRVRFRHDPELLLGTLSAGRQPQHLPERPCTVVGSLDSDGRLRWGLINHGEARGGLTDGAAYGR